MTITLKPAQERALQEAIRTGLIHSVDDFIETAIDALPHRGHDSRADAVRRMQDFGNKYRLSLGEPVTRDLLHEGHRP